MKCSKCGSDLTANDKFCPNCGQTITSTGEIEIVGDPVQGTPVDGVQPTAVPPQAAPVQGVVAPPQAGPVNTEETPNQTVEPTVAVNPAPTVAQNPAVNPNSNVLFEKHIEKKLDKKTQIILIVAIALAVAGIVFAVLYFVNPFGGKTNNGNNGGNTTNNVNNGGNNSGNNGQNNGGNSGNNGNGGNNGGNTPVTNEKTVTAYGYIYTIPSYLDATLEENYINLLNASKTLNIAVNLSKGDFSSINVTTAKSNLDANGYRVNNNKTGTYGGLEFIIFEATYLGHNVILAYCQNPLNSSQVYSIGIANTSSTSYDYTTLTEMANMVKQAKTSSSFSNESDLSEFNFDVPTFNV